MAEFFFFQGFIKRKREKSGEGPDNRVKTEGRNPKKRNEATERYKGDGEVENIRGKSLV
jgi:hypothetical protein